MKSFAIFSALLALVSSASVTIENADLKKNPAYGYMTRVGVPLADKIRAAEAQSATLNKLNSEVTPTLKNIDGSVARLGEVPYQAGLIIDILHKQSVCGGSLLNNRRVLTAAHCWNDGKNQGLRITVVLGSVKLFSGGTRVQTSRVITHRQWQPKGFVNDIAMIYFPHLIKLTNTIQPIALPSGSELQDSFAGQKVIASGFSSTKDGDLSYVPVQVITNDQCANVFHNNVRPSTICTSGVTMKNGCRGYSGGSIVVSKNNKRILLGVNSFGTESCQSDRPLGYTRVTYYIQWITKQL